MKVSAASALAAALLAVVGCARSVEALAPPDGDPPPVQTNPVTFVVAFHPRADTSAFRATVDPPSGPAASDIDITAAFSRPLTPGGQSTATLSAPQTSCSLLPLGAADARRLRVEADMRPGRPFDSTGHDHAFRLPCAAGPPPPPPPPAGPSFDLTVTPARQSVVWGDAATFQVDLPGRGGFAGPVTLALRGAGGGPPPPGISAAVAPSAAATPSAAAPAAAATLQLTTAAVATAPGPAALEVRATSPGGPSRTAALTLAVVRTPGLFVFRPPISAPSATCGGVAGASFANIGSAGAPDFRVTFSAPPSGAGADTPATRAVFYLFSPPPGCLGVALHPLTGVTGQPVAPALTWFNLGPSPAIGAPPVPDAVETLVAVNWRQFWFGPDQSLLLLLATKKALSAPGAPQDYRLFLHDAATGAELDRQDILPRSVGTTADPVADICRVELGPSDDTVTVSYRERLGQPPTCPVAVDRTDCGAGPPRNCRIATRTLSF